MLESFLRTEKASASCSSTERYEPGTSDTLNITVLRMVVVLSLIVSELQFSFNLKSYLVTFSLTSPGNSNYFNSLHKSNNLSLVLLPVSSVHRSNPPHIVSKNCCTPNGRNAGKWS